LTGEGRSLGNKISGGRGRPPANILIPLERQLNALQLAADSFYIMKLCSRLFVLHCRSRPKYDTSMQFDPHFEEVRGGVEPWLTAIWKARAEFLLSVVEFLFLSLRVEAKAKRVKTRSLQEWVGHFERKFQGEEVVSGEYFLVSTKLDRFCYPTVQTAPCYVSSF